MPMPGQPVRNPDGTIQVAPPTVSAFAPQPTQAPPPAQIPANTPGVQQDNGVAGAIQSMIQALAQAFAPKAITQRGKKISQSVDEASGAPQTSDLGNQF